MPAGSAPLPAMRQAGVLVRRQARPAPTAAPGPPPAATCPSSPPAADSGSAQTKAATAASAETIPAPAPAAGAEAIPAPAAGAGRRRLSVHLALQGRVGGRCSRAAAAAPCASSAGGARVDCLALRTPDFARTGEVQRHGLERHGHLHRG